MKAENAIEVHHVSKSFKVYQDKGNMLRQRLLNHKRNRYVEREVLHDISFEIRKGETVGLIGTNGCGKSTTLKMLTKILYPNAGTIETQGKLYSMIELGAGFHPDMTGRENVYINASIYGIRRKEVDARMEEIIRFSELENFIDNPLRTYSSGMNLRLAFSVAINVNADILLVDEILAVGDQNFQNKCLRKLKSLQDQGVTIVLVSHNMAQVESFCSRVIWLKDGTIKEDGPAREVCTHYREAANQQALERQIAEMRRQPDQQTGFETAVQIIPQCDPSVTRGGLGNIVFTDIRLLDKSGAMCTSFQMGEQMKIQLRLHDFSPADMRISNITIEMIRRDWLLCYGISTEKTLHADVTVDADGNAFAEAEVGPVALLPDSYRLNLCVYDQNGEVEDFYNGCIAFEVKAAGSNVDEIGVSSMQHKWMVNG